MMILLVDFRKIPRERDLPGRVNTVRQNREQAGHNLCVHVVYYGTGSIVRSDRLVLATAIEKELARKKPLGEFSSSIQPNMFLSC